jgi:RNA polymerase sigma-70 factor (ECF subfamily)
MLSDEQWETSLRALLPQALALAVRLCGSLPAAEDAVQDGLLRIVQGRDSFRGDSQPRTWMLRIVLNACRDWQRKHLRHLRWEAEAGRAVTDESEGLPDTRERSPREQLETTETRGQVRRAVESLPQRQREVVQLLIWQDLPPSQVAELLGTTPQNVYATFHAAKQQLRQRLPPELLPPHP